MTGKTVFLGKTERIQSVAAMALLTAAALATTSLAQEAGYESADVGAPELAGSLTAVEGGFDVVGGGERIGDRSDQFHFAYQMQTGDFDVRVRLAALEFTEVWSQAGLMVRETLEADSVQLSVLATPTVGGVSFLSRAISGRSATSQGAHRVNYPQTWLRLARQGPLVSGFASYDGLHWQRLGEVSTELPETVFLGMAVCSHQVGAGTTAAFRDFGDVGDDAAGPMAVSVESPGPSSRRTGLAITEIMYHPVDRPDGKDLEFIELMNTDSIPAELGGYHFDGSVSYVFPEGFVLGPGRLIVIAKSPADFQAVFEHADVLGGFDENLPNDEGTLLLRNRAGAIMLDLRYQSAGEWPVAPDGTGHSLVLNRPSYGEASPEAWAASALLGGSPGAIEPVLHDPWEGLVINEFLARSVPPLVDYLELYNHGAEALDLSGLLLSDDPTVTKFRFPEGASLAAGEFLALDENELGFGLNGAGERLYLRSSVDGRVLDAVRFGAQAADGASGRFPNGGKAILPLASPTPGAPNQSPASHEVVINEIMFHPVSGDRDDEFIELFNRGAAAVDLSGWQLRGGIRFEFPAGTLVPGEGYLVIGRNAARLVSRYAHLGEADVVGDYQGSLGNAGDEIRLLRPDTDPRGESVMVLADQVDYRDSRTWGQWADGGGSSLELRDPGSDNRFGSNWDSSVESEKSEWTQIEHTALLEQGRGRIDDLQIFLQGAGECLVDDVEMVDEAGTNFIVNGAFDEGADSWFFQGTHDASSVVLAEGDMGNNHLHLVATARGDNGANRVRYRIRRPFPEPGTRVTLRARVKWLRGHPEILIRPKGNYIEAIGQLEVPAELGTPGQPNSQRVANTGPVIADVQHFPILPQDGDAIRITAQVTDPQGVAGVQLNYRLDTEEMHETLPMRDDGTMGDRVGGDGVYTAVIAPQAPGSTVAFFVTAEDSGELAQVNQFPASAPLREGLVRVGEEIISGSFGTYRIWYTRDTVREWTRRLRLHNGDLDTTFVYGNERVVYNTGALYSGSPFVSPSYTGPTGNLCGYVLHTPKDDTVLGATDFVLDWPIRDGTLQLEQVAFWMAEQMDLPYLRRRNINLFVDGVHRGRVYEDVQQPSRDVMSQFHPEADGGDLYKIEDWFEFSSGGARQFNVDATLVNFTDENGEKFLPRYRYNWRKRAVRGSAHDYSNLFELVDVLNGPNTSGYTDSVESLVDIEEWMGIFAVEHIVGNWDSYGYRRGKNMYAYKPDGGRWVLHMWDIDFALGASTDPPQSSMFGTNEPVVQRLFFHPPFTRVYYQAMQQAVDGPLMASRSTPVMQANLDALRENGIRSSSFRGAERYIASRKQFLEQQIAGADANFAIITNSGASFDSAENLVTLRGTAPFRVHQIAVNGVVFPLRWLNANQWEISFVLPEVENRLDVRGFDRDGEFVRGASRRITINYTGEPAAPEDHLVINEVMANPPLPGAAYVEIHNTATQAAFALGGYRLRGVDYEFPDNAVIGPGGYLVVVADRAAASAAYGPAEGVIGEYSGRLNPEGETLQLVQIDAESGDERVIDTVTYGVQFPWPALAAGGGSSLQLIDPEQDNDRVANWGAVGEVDDEQDWRFASVSGTAEGNELLVFLSANPAVVSFDGIEGFWTGEVRVEEDRDDIGFRFERQADGSLLPILVDGGQDIPFEAVTVEDRNVLITWNPDGVEIRLEGVLAEDGLSMEGALIQVVPDLGRFEGTFTLRRDFPGGDVFLDDVTVVRGEEAEQGENLVANGSFEEDFASSWSVAENHQMSEISNEVQFSGGQSLRVRAASGGFNAGSAISQQIAGLDVGEMYTLSFRYLIGAGGEGLTVSLGDHSLLSTVNIESRPAATTTFTPGFANSNRERLAPFPALRINELQLVNAGTLVDAMGDEDPWLELYHGGSESLSLEDLALSNDPDRLDLWPFPSGASIEPGEHRIIWLDGAVEEQSDQEWHASWRWERGDAGVFLSQQIQESSRIVDFFLGDLPESSGSVGLLPNGVANTFRFFPLPTPAAINVPREASSGVVISEWMAANVMVVADPAGQPDLEYDDWFELANTGDLPVDISGYFLSDNPDDPLKFEVPNGTVIGPGGFLLVWADGQADQNGLGMDLHVNFRLDRGGESIGLYGPRGDRLDFVEFGEQTPDRSQGRVSLDREALIEDLPVASPGRANVEQVLVIQEIQVEPDGRVVISVNAQPGQRYQLRVRDGINDAGWQALGSPVMANEGSLVFVDDTASERGQRFYTVEQLASP